MRRLEVSTGSVEESAAAARGAGEITAEARAESPTKSGIRGETPETGKASKLRRRVKNRLGATESGKDVENKHQH